MGRPRKSESNLRLASGAVQAGEPRESEVTEAAVNAPSNKFIVYLGEEAFPLAELGFIEWRAYISVLSETIERTLKDLTPIIEKGLSAWGVIKNFSSSNTERLRQVALETDADTIASTMATWGINLTDTQAQELKDIALNRGDFDNRIASLVFQPILGVLRTEVSINSVLTDAADRLPELAYASLASSLRRRRVNFDPKELNQRILDEADGFDLFEIANRQIEFYAERGKIRSFFGSLRGLLPMAKANSGTPGA